MNTDCSRISPVSRLMKATVTGQRARVGEVLLAALLERCDRLVEDELTELDGEIACVVLDRRDVVDRLAQAALAGICQPRERAALDVDEVGYVNCLVEARESAARPESIYSGQETTPSEGDETGRGGAPKRDWLR